MSEDRTAETQDVRSFEERTLAKFHLNDERFEGVNIRLEQLEQRQYDTKPIWERALAAIVETNKAVRETNECMNEGFAAVHTEISSIHRRLDGMDKRFDAVDKRFDAMDKRFDAVDKRFDKQEIDSQHNFRKLRRTIEALNETLLEIRVDQRYVDNRLEKIEEKVFPEDSN